MCGQLGDTDGGTRPHCNTRGRWHHIDGLSLFPRVAFNVQLTHADVHYVDDSLMMSRHHIIVFLQVLASNPTFIKSAAYDEACFGP